MLTSRGSRHLYKNADEVGGIAQLGERLLCKQNVGGSIPSTSTKFRTNGRRKWLPAVNDNKMLRDSVNPNHRLHLVKILKSNYGDTVGRDK